MGLEELQKEIAEQARKEIKAIEEGTAAILSSIEAETKSALAEIRKKYKELLDTAKSKLVKIQEAEVSSVVAQLVLEKKQHLIGMVVAEAMRKIKANGKEYLPRLVEKAKKDMDVAVICCSQKDVSLVNGIRTVAKEIDGIIAENNDGTISIDYTYETLLRRIKEKKIQEIAKVLFT